MGLKKLSGAELEEMFQEGRFVARALQVSPLSNGKPSSNLAEEEMNYLHTKKSQEGEHQNVERHGQRGRSATLLVPGVDMTLFNSVGFLYDADKSTIKAYMFHDSQTMSQIQHTNYYNVDMDKKKFEPIISRTEFMEKYRDYVDKINNPELRDNSRNYEHEEALERYNEVLGNFFPESLIGVVGKDSSLETKRNLLFLKNVLSKQDQNLPMVLMDEGKVKTWSPDLTEIAAIINDSKSKITKNAEQYKTGTPDELLKEFAKNLGYTLDNISFDTPVTAEHLKSNNKFEFQAKEVVDYISDITKMPKGGAFSYGIEGRLEEVVNKRLLSEGKEPVKDLKSTIIEQQDIQNLVSLLDHELNIKDSKHEVMNPGQLKAFSDGVTSNINLKRSGNEVDMNNVPKLGKGVSQTISEFFNKVASFFKENIVSSKVDESKSMKERLAAIKASDKQPVIEAKIVEEEHSKIVPSA